MKKLRITQLSTGKYNLLSSEETLSFYAVIEEDGKTIEKDGNKAIIQYSGDKEELDEFENAVEDMDFTFLFSKCFSYSKRVWGSTDYKGNALLFASEYIKNFEELSENYANKEKEKLQQQIKRLQEKLDNSNDLYDNREDIKNEIQKDIDRYKKWIEQNEKEMAEFKEGSEKITELKKKNEQYSLEIEKLKKGSDLK